MSDAPDDEASLAANSSDAPDEGDRASCEVRSRVDSADKAKLLRSMSSGSSSGRGSEPRRNQSVRPGPRFPSTRADARPSQPTAAIRS